MQIKELLYTNRMIPVLTINDLDDTLPLCSALVAGGLTIIEITLRTEPSLDAVEMISKELPEINVGVGTLLDPMDLNRAKNSVISASFSSCGYISSTAKTRCSKATPICCKSATRLGEPEPRNNL